MVKKPSKSAGMAFFGIFGQQQIHFVRIKKFIAFLVLSMNILIEHLR